MLYYLNNNSFLSVANRMYYALFYVITAYLTTKNEIVKTHKGVNIKFHQYLALTNLVTKEEAKLYNELFERRHEFDYNDFVILKEEEIKAMFTDTKALIHKIETLITIND